MKSNLFGSEIERVIKGTDDKRAFWELKGYDELPWIWL